MGGNIIVIVPDERFEQQKLYILSLQIAEGLGPNLSFQSYFAQKKITGQIGQIYLSDNSWHLCKLLLRCGAEE